MSTESTTPQEKLALVLGALLLRLWIGVRAFQSGIEKFAGTKASDAPVDGPGGDYGLTAAETVKTYSLSNYHGVLESLYAVFGKEPLMPGFGLKIYNAVLGPVLLVLGITILLGIASRFSLFALGLLYVSLTWGLVLLGGAQGDSGVAWLGIHVILIVMALMLARHNRFTLVKKLENW